MDPIRITVVTPTFNSEATIAQTIESVLSQSGPFELEYVLVDGASTDRTAEIAARYGDRLTWISEPDTGVHDALFKGFSRSTGEVMAFLGSDDIQMPWTLSTVASIFRDLPQVEWISSMVPMALDAAGLPFWTNKYPPYSRQAFLDGIYTNISFLTPYAVNYIPGESTFWRRRLYNRIDHSLWTSFKRAGDFALWAEFYRTAELVGVNIPLTGWRTSHGQLSTVVDDLLYEVLSALVLLQEAVGHRPSLVGTEPLSYDGLEAIKRDHRSLDSHWTLERRRFQVLPASPMKSLAVQQFLT